jgi:hypothetical protein
LQVKTEPVFAGEAFTTGQHEVHMRLTPSKGLDNLRMFREGPRGCFGLYCMDPSAPPNASLYVTLPTGELRGKPEGPDQWPPLRYDNDAAFAPRDQRLRRLMMNVPLIYHRGRGPQRPVFDYLDFTMHVDMDEKKVSFRLHSFTMFQNMKVPEELFESPIVHELQELQPPLRFFYQGANSRVELL